MKTPYSVFLALILLLFSMSTGYAADSMVLIEPDRYLKNGKKIYPSLKSFYIDRFEVTVEEYFDFLKGGTFKNLKGYRTPKRKHLKQAAARIHWFEAQSYCHSKGKRLPTNTEWSAAAVGADRIFPWGNDNLNDKKANYCDVNCSTPWMDFEENDQYEKIAPVGSYPEGQTPEGLFDMGGNLWEWTSTVSGQNRDLEFQGKEHSQDDNYLKMIIRGGSYGSRADQIKNRSQSQSPAFFRSSHVGFRCVRTVP